MNRTLTDYIGFRISSNLRKRLEKIADQENKSVSKIIREALRDMFDNVKQTDPQNRSDLNPPPGPNKPKQKQTSITKSYYPRSNLNSKDRKKLNEEIRKGITLEKTRYCEECKRRYVGAECPRKEEHKEEEK